MKMKMLLCWPWLWEAAWLCPRVGQQLRRGQSRVSCCHSPPCSVVPCMSLLYPKGFWLYGGLCDEVLALPTELGRLPSWPLGLGRSLSCLEMERPCGFLSSCLLRNLIPVACDSSTWLSGPQWESPPGPCPTCRGHRWVICT